MVFLSTTHAHPLVLKMIKKTKLQHGQGPTVARPARANDDAGSAAQGPRSIAIAPEATQLRATP